MASGVSTVTLPWSSMSEPPQAWMASRVFRVRPSYCDSCSVRQPLSSGSGSQEARKASQFSGASGISSVLR